VDDAEFIGEKGTCYFPDGPYDHSVNVLHRFHYYWQDVREIPEFCEQVPALKLTPLNQAELQKVNGMCQTFPSLYYLGPQVVCRSSYRIPKLKVQNYNIFHIGTANLFRECTASLVGA
jgi:hypothetical protein